MTIEELRVRISGAVKVPDPARIDSTGDWYILSHISDGLVAFDSEKKKFVPHIAESCRINPNGEHLFTLREGATFHDGTPITTTDVEWSIKRQPMLKTSTHFPLWEYVGECNQLTQLASPETGIWAAADMNPETGAIIPSKYSGPYYVSGQSNDALALKRNENSIISRLFPFSPREIKVKKVALGALDNALLKRDVDLVVRSYRPYGEPDWASNKIRVHASAPSTMIYLQATGTLQNRRYLDRRFVEYAWKALTDNNIFPADSFLPFSERYGLNRSEFLAQLPSKGDEVIRVVAPENFFSQEFLELLKRAASKSGVAMEISIVPGSEWLSTFDNPKASEKYDFILSSYAASERYPAVQLRYITGTLVVPPIDLKKAESVNLDDGQIALLKGYEKWLIQTGQAVPLFFNSTLILAHDDISIGTQPSTDAEIELWRVQR